MAIFTIAPWTGIEILTLRCSDHVTQNTTLSVVTAHLILLQLGLFVPYFVPILFQEANAKA